jgi:hypothetical protein
MRMQDTINNGQTPVIIHLGDHDPTGIDMSRDIVARLEMFLGENEGEGFIFERVALNMDQIQRYNPPPQPAKTTDSRYKKYIEKFGDDSWELDALTPEVMTDLIEDRVMYYREDDKWEKAEAAETTGRERLAKLATAERNPPKRRRKRRGK